MPANDKLQWFDIDDFTAGIWDSNAVKDRFAAPPKAFRTLTGYMPVKGGGLRAGFTASQTITPPNGANEQIIGIFARNGVSRAAGVGGTGNDSTDMIVVTMNTSDFKVRIYRRDGTVGSPTWSTRLTTLANSNAAHQICDFAYFKDVNGVEWVLMSIFCQTGSIAGLYAMRFDYTVASNTGNDGLTSRLQAYCGPICISQARILIGTGNDYNIQYSSVGLTTGFGSQTGIAPNRAESNISIISGMEPSDLLIGKEGAPWVIVSGDITSTSTPIREMGDDHHQRQDKQQCPRVPGGIAFIEGNGRVFVTNDGRTFQSLSDNLQSLPLNYDATMVGTGTMAYLNSLLFAPGPSSTINVYDFDAQCWHRLSDIGYVFGWADPYGGNIWCANHSTTQAIVGFNVMDNGSRANTGVIQTVPYADKNGRNVDIREVQLFVDTHATSEFKVELLDESDASVVTRYATVTGAKHDLLVFKFPYSKSNYLSVKVTPRSVDGSSEAPTLERIRIGFAYNNLVTIGS